MGSEELLFKGPHLGRLLGWSTFSASGGLRHQVPIYGTSAEALPVRAQGLGVRLEPRLGSSYGVRLLRSNREPPGRLGSGTAPGGRGGGGGGRAARPGVQGIPGLLAPETAACHPYSSTGALPGVGTGHYTPWILQLASLRQHPAQLSRQAGRAPGSGGGRLELALHAGLDQADRLNTSHNLVQEASRSSFLKLRVTDVLQDEPEKPGVQSASCPSPYTGLHALDMKEGGLQHHAQPGRCHWFNGPAGQERAFGSPPNDLTGAIGSTQNNSSMCEPQLSAACHWGLRGLHFGHESTGPIASFSGDFSAATHH